MEAKQAERIVVIGGAGLLGKALCAFLAERGHLIAVADRDEARALETASSIPGGRAIGVGLDICNEASIDAAIETVTREIGRPTGLVNSAYPRNEAYGTHWKKVRLSDFNENVGLHLGGYFCATQRFATLFESECRGSVVNISSIYGVVAPRFSVYEGTTMTMPVEYAAIKSAIIHLTRYFASALKGCGIRFNCVSLGGLQDGQPASFLQRYNDQCLNKGMLEARDVCGTVAFLFSPDSTYINGQNLIVDDGFTLL